MLIHPMTKEALQHVLEFTRQSDRDEIAAASKLPVNDSINYAVAVAVYAYELCTDNGVPVAIFGVNDATSPVDQIRWGVPWLVGTDWIDEHPTQFLRASPRMLELIEGDFDILWNLALNSNKKALRWLRWLGFTIDRPRPWGPFQQRFNPFYKLRKPCALIQSPSVSHLPLDQK